MGGYYRSGYRRRSSYAPTVGRVRKPNRRPGACRGCGEDVPAGAGELWREESGDWSVVHTLAEWMGSPVSGRYVGGCPKDAADPQAERDRLAKVAATAAAMAPAPAARRSYGSKYAYTSSGARVTMSSRRCEDAPCCGCCD